MQQGIQGLANPIRFMTLSARLLPWLTIAALVLLGIGLAMSFAAPEDYQHKHTAKIMFVHVPSAWLAMGIYALVALSSFGFLVWRHPLADVSAKAALPIGAAFTLLALVTGSLWGKPGWGAYWVWDARLTSVLILFFLYMGLIALRSAFDDEALAARLTAILSLVGVVILPVIKFSVDWWNSLHQAASVLRLGGPALHPAFLRPLIVIAFALAVVIMANHMKAMRNEILRRRLAALMMSRAQTMPERAAGGAVEVGMP
jgi:heme exporter protein C